MTKNVRYLGDGVYAEWNGFQIVLRVFSNPANIIYLEPSVLDALNEFYKSIFSENEE